MIKRRKRGSSHWFCRGGITNGFSLSVGVSVIPAQVSINCFQRNELYYTNSLLGGVPREQKMLKGHLSRVIYHQVY